MLDKERIGMVQKLIRLWTKSAKRCQHRDGLLCKKLTLMYGTGFGEHNAVHEHCNIHTCPGQRRKEECQTKKDLAGRLSSYVR